jgi:dTDP-4-dehydrorhamnose 3,5-epimerase
VIFTETRLKGAFVIEMERREDDRGFFARAFCRREFAEHGLNPDIAQVNASRNHLRGTIRGLHFQFPPHAEAKFIRATRGAILDVIVDLRPESPTYLQHVSVRLSADEGRALYVPERFAHGCQGLEAGTEFYYHASTPYAPGFEGGLSPFDPELAIEWALPPSGISPKDAAWKPLGEIREELQRKMA